MTDKPSPNILLTRIDNRLIHGQVGVVWTNFLNANLIVVANNRVANDKTQQMLLDLAVPQGVESRYFTLEKTIEVIHKASSKQKIFLLVETPQDALTLVKGGVPISQLNVSNMHFKEGKTQLTSVISVDEDDKRCFKELLSLGIKVDIRKVPTDALKSIESLF